MSRHAAVWSATIALVLLGLGAPLLLLQSRPWVAWMSGMHSQSSEAGLTQSQTLRLAEQVRLFVTTGRGQLPSTVDGRPAFDASAVAHLADVGSALRFSAGMVWLLVSAFAAVGVLSVRRREARWLGTAMGFAGYALLAGVSMLALVALIDFDSFFSAFHVLFFRAGTWTFPYDSLLIRLFPEPFWTWMGAAWAVLSVSVGVAYVLLGRRLDSRNH